MIDGKKSPSERHSFYTQGDSDIKFVPCVCQLLFAAILFFFSDIFATVRSLY